MSNGHSFVPQTPFEVGRGSGVTSPKVPVGRRPGSNGSVSSSANISFLEALAQVESCHRREIEWLRASHCHNNVVTPPPSKADLCIQPFRESWEAGFDVPMASSTCHPFTKKRQDGLDDSYFPRVTPIGFSSEARQDARSMVPQPGASSHTLPTMDIPWTTSVATKWAELSWALTDTTLQCVLNPVWQVALDAIVTPSGSLGSSKSNFDADPSGELDIAMQPSMLVTATGGMKMRTRANTTLSLISLRMSTRSECRPLHPSGKARLTWDLMGTILCLFELVFLPLTMTSLLESNTEIALINCIYWTVDLGVAFFTGYYTDYGLLERRFRRIARRYLKTWFVIDCTLAMLDWFILAFGEAWAYGKAMKSVARFVRIARLLRILRLASKMQDQLGRVTSQALFTVLRLVSYMVMVLLLNHYIACLWCATWGNLTYLDGRDEFTSYKYITGLHWSFAHCFLSSMDIFPENFGQRVFTCIVLIVSLAVFSIILSMITNDALALRSASSERNNKNLILLTFFAEHKLPIDLTCRVWRFVLQHKLFDGRAHQHEQSKQALQLLPIHVQQEIRHEWFSPVLRSHPFFETYSDLDPMAMKVLCNTAVSVVTLLPEEELLWPVTTHLEQAVFVEKGVLLFHPFGEPRCVKIWPSMWACEEALWGSSASLNGKMCASVETCTLLLVGFKDFKDVVFLHRRSSGFVRRYAAVFVDEFNKACATYDKVDEVLFNDGAKLGQLVDMALQRTTQTNNMESVLAALVSHRSSHRSSSSTEVSDYEGRKCNGSQSLSSSSLGHVAV